MRTKKTFLIKDPKNFREKLFWWSQQFHTAVWLDSNNDKQQYSNFDNCLAVEEFTSIKTDYKGAFEKLKEYYSFTKDYLFGYISYDVKNDSENLHSENADQLYFADIYFFQPQKLIFIKGNSVEFHYLKMIDDEIDSDFKSINQIKYFSFNGTKEETNIKIKSRIHKDKYYQKITSVLHHIHRGNIYEANFCQEFYAEKTTINPYKIYTELNTISEPPFATFMRLDEQYLLSASPERYLKKEGTKIISQPIKGTAKRFVNKEKDEKSASDLKHDKKERAENIMIVDLVRNDLSRIAQKGSVTVEELCEIYSFKQVHQLISTVVCNVKHDVHPVDIIKETFPMGSMTGTPKISAMQIIENLEETKRGLYSGTVGYFTPNGNFDFNVVIRSILYNADEKYVSFSVGGAITTKSSPKKEYEECLLKAKAMKFVLQKGMTMS